MLQSCSLHQSSHCTKPRKPFRALREPGEDLAKASRIHFSVSDRAVIGCCPGERRLSGSFMLGHSGFGRRNYRCRFGGSGSVRVRGWLFAGADASFLSVDACVCSAVKSVLATRCLHWLASSLSLSLVLRYVHIDV